MIKHINFQTITQNGQPAFVVIPYDEFLQIYPQAKSEATIPHEVVRLIIKNEMSTLRAWREYLGFTQKDIADRLGISQAALSQIEAVNSRPRKETLRKLAEIYNVAIELLR
jgi:DNA-binding XRE family transcriptional regulator